MRNLATLACLSLLAMSACQSSGYYDTSGTYHEYGTSDGSRHENAMGNTAGEDGGAQYSAPPAGNTTIIYKRPGYYDSNGYYLSRDSGPQVAPQYQPPRGMCRVWFTNREPQYQPPVESCTGIQSRVPAGAYVIYGG